jgi:hypothetical protein
MKTLIVFDIDGTVADIEHRRGYVRSNPKNWKAFEAAMIQDDVIKPVKNVFKRFVDDPNVNIVFASGRGEQDRAKTVQWLFENGFGGYRKLYMRPARDYRPDYEIKQEILNEIVREFGKKPDFAFDDRKQVVDMWIENGIFVFDVSQGKGDF